MGTPKTEPIFVIETSTDTGLNTIPMNKIIFCNSDLTFYKKIASISETETLTQALTGNKITKITLSNSDLETLISEMVSDSDVYTKSEVYTKTETDSAINTKTQNNLLYYEGSSAPTTEKTLWRDTDTNQFFVSYKDNQNQLHWFEI